MKPAILSLAVGLLLTVPVVAGCAGEDAEAGEAAYPPVGYTPPAETAPAQPPARPPPPPLTSQPAMSQDDQGPPADDADGQRAWQWAPPPDDASGDGPVGAAGDAAGAPADDSGGYADTDPSALSDFRSTLEPYGTWTDDPNYGSVWVPSPSV